MFSTFMSKSRDKISHVYRGSAKEDRYYEDKLPKIGFRFFHEKSASEENYFPF